MSFQQRFMHHTNYLKIIVDMTIIIFTTEDKDESEIVVTNEVVDALEDEEDTTKQINIQYNYNMHKIMLLFQVQMVEPLIVLNVSSV